MSQRRRARACATTAQGPLWPNDARDFPASRSCSEIGAEAKSTPGTASLPGALPPAGPEQGITRYTCSQYVLHNLETPTGYRFAITSDAAAGDLRAALWHIYSELFVGYALKNPLYVTGTPIKSAMFAEQVDAFMKALPAFTAKA